MSVCPPPFGGQFWGVSQFLSPLEWSPGGLGCCYQEGLWVTSLWPCSQIDTLEYWTTSNHPPFFWCPVLTRNCFLELEFSHRDLVIFPFSDSIPLNKLNWFIFHSFIYIYIPWFSMIFIWYSMIFLEHPGWISLNPLAFFTEVYGLFQVRQGPGTPGSGSGHLVVVLAGIYGCPRWGFDPFHIYIYIYYIHTHIIYIYICRYILMYMYI